MSRICNVLTGERTVDLGLLALNGGMVWVAASLPIGVIGVYFDSNGATSATELRDH